MSQMLAPWHPSVAQRKAARALALGYTHGEAATKAGVVRETVGRWAADPEFDAYVTVQFERTWERIEPAIMAMAEVSIELVSEMLHGRIKADDKRLPDARRLIDRLLDRLLAVQPAGEPENRSALQQARDTGDER